ncbi:hypothetical protein COCON_G00033800 [Conger conger]|uniref:Tumor necrosis factor receptor superfamily member 12A n=1 Tax=Conger conger TaxID=82655 RepID=A0A9Q1DZ71_CONCO|nr:hypothetical protein COCON_G00033800 [Conger conger]
MDSRIVSLLYGVILLMGINFAGTYSQRTLLHTGECKKEEFWNSDVSRCLPCSTCKEFPKIPSCDTCTVSDEASYTWKITAITSLSVLAVVIVSGVLLGGVLVHQYHSRMRKTLCEPIEETTGPLYQV